MKTFGLLAWFRLLRADVGRFPGAAKNSATELGASAFYRTPAWLMLPILIGTWLASRTKMRKGAGMPAPSTRIDRR